MIVDTFYLNSVLMRHQSLIVLFLYCNTKQKVNFYRIYNQHFAVRPIYDNINIKKIQCQFNLQSAS